MRILLFWLLLLPLPGIAQEKKWARPPYTLKIAPVALINPVQQSVALQADIPFSARWGLDMGIGAVFHSAPLAANIGESYWGLKLRPAIKYYIEQTRWGNNSLSLVLKYNYIINDRYLNVIRQGGQYAEWRLQRRQYVTGGISLLFTSQDYIGKNKRFFIEPFMGFGYRRIQVTYLGLPPDAEILPERGVFILDRAPGNYNAPDLMIGFCLGVRMGRNEE